MRFKKIIWLFSALVVAAAAVFAVGLWNLKNEAGISGKEIYEEFQRASDHLLNFNLGEARESFLDINGEIGKLESKAGWLGLLSLSEIKNAFQSLGALSKGALAVGKELGEFKDTAFSRFVGGEGNLLISNLERIGGELSGILKANEDLRNLAASVNYPLLASDRLLETGVSLKNAKNFLDAFLDWLKKSEPQHLLIVFQNPSEIRPAGGFIGSYTHLKIQDGSMKEMDVRDIYDPDGQLDLKIIPPKPLQLITIKWGARDANWFFDFPVSAKKVIDLLEASKFYKERGVRFSGLVAVNVNVIQDILEITGSIPLPAYGLTINHLNFLPEVQREVEAGRDKLAGEPKRILKILTPILFEKIASLEEEQKQALAAKLASRIERKDFLAYFKDLAIESYLQVLGIGGEIKKLPADFSGDYLAVAAANIGGGKSDAFVRQEIQVISRLTAAGNAENTLIITRSHFGENETEWWYRKTNKIHFQIFVPPGAGSVLIQGDRQAIAPPMNYSAAGYLKDKDVVFLESGLAFGKKIFTAWLSVPAGEKKELEIRYFAPGAADIRSGVYQFVFDKQSGVNGSLEYSVTAPPGYKWKESDSFIFTYFSDDLPSRVELKMTLVPAEDRR